MPLFQHRFGGTMAAGDVWLFTWWSDHPGGVTSANNDAVQWLNDLWAGDQTDNGYGSVTTADVTATSVTTGEIDTSTGTQLARADATVSLAGSATSSALPGDVAIVVSLRTALANRRGRGRFFLPQPASEVLTDVGRLSSASRTTILDALAFAWGNYVADGTPVVYSRTNRATSIVDSYDIGDLLDTQRGRENALVEDRSSNSMP